MEKFTSFERVVGKANENKKNEIIKEKEWQFNNQEFQELIGKEREKTPKELQIIELANRLTNEIRQKYDLDLFNIPSKNIHIVKKNEWPKKASAIYVSMAQSVALQEQAASIVFMKKVVHEMLHFKSYNALQILDDGSADEYRVGLTVSMRNGKGLRFRILNEAVTEEMTRSILAKVANNPLFSAEIKETNEIIKKHLNAMTNDGKYLFNSDTIYAKMEDGSNKINIESFTNTIGRKILSILIDKLFEQNKEDFRNREDIFEMFSKAMMTGNIISIGKLIDRTFGEGVFRKIGELDENIQEQDNFINSL
jgi:hypothetical protein